MDDGQGTFIPTIPVGDTVDTGEVLAADVGKLEQGGVSKAQCA